MHWNHLREGLKSKILATVLLIAALEFLYNYTVEPFSVVSIFSGVSAILALSLATLEILRFSNLFFRKKDILQDETRIY